MDKFVTVKKSTSAATQVGKAEKEKQRPVYKYNPYPTKKVDERKFNGWKDRKRTEKILEPLRPSNAAITKHLLSTLKDEHNPITHSDIYQRSDYVTSAASGHQRGEGRGAPLDRAYNDTRRDKLAEQLPTASSDNHGVLRGVRVYINGYLKNTTDIEMKRIVAQAGGEVLYTASRATHILTSQQLNGSKTHKFLTAKSKIKPHVVRPEWVTDSISAGKRMPERTYSAIHNAAVGDLKDMLTASGSSCTCDSAIS